MAKIQTVFICQNCGAQSPRWQGRCPECGQWNSFVEEVQASSKSQAKRAAGSTRSEGFGQSEALHKQLERLPQLTERVPSGFSEMDRVLGGGYLPSSVLLVGGEPGIGKSTLLLQSLGDLAARGVLCLYASGEESAAQVGGRAKRLGIADTDHLQFLATTSIEELRAAIERLRPQVLVADSVQTLLSSELESSAGTVSQVRAVAQTLTDLSKSTGMVSLLVGHVTKEGTVAGPRLLEHMVDAVFYFELASGHGYRMLRGQKNRFGATHEAAVFEMSSRGLLQVDNPSVRFLAERAKEMSGSSVVAQLEGSRPFLTEFQALTQKCFQGYPRRTVQGVDQNRIAVLLAVIEKSLGLSFSDQDVYCKVASGDRIDEPAADLALLMALVSAVEDRPLPASLILVGEVGLGGELRSVPALSARLSEARSVGLTRAVVPAWNEREASQMRGLEVLPARTVKEAYSLAWKVSQ